VIAKKTARVLPASRHLLLLGHRGAHANKSIPENTIASFDQAMADGCDGFEFDVRMTSDGGAVICHDPNDPKLRSLRIAQTSARKLAHLPRLHQVLARYRQSAFLDIELKVAGLETKVAGLLRRYNIRRGFVVSSFLPNVLRDLHAADPKIPLGLICETRVQFWRWRELPVDYVIVRYSLAGERLIREVQDAGKKVFVWTVNDRTTAKRFAARGVDGIISDDARMLTRTLRPGQETYEIERIIR
jgi:glycerophosphoryl diester phosphodiesterase